MPAGGPRREASPGDPAITGAPPLRDPVSRVRGVPHHAGDPPGDDLAGADRRRRASRPSRRRRPSPATVGDDSRARGRQRERGAGGRAACREALAARFPPSSRSRRPPGRRTPSRKPPVLDATSSGEKAPSPGPDSATGVPKVAAGRPGGDLHDVAGAGAATHATTAVPSALMEMRSRVRTPAPESVTGALKGWPAADCAVTTRPPCSHTASCEPSGWTASWTCDEIPCRAARSARRTGRRPAAPARRWSDDPRPAAATRRAGRSSAARRRMDRRSSGRRDRRRRRCPATAAPRSRWALSAKRRHATPLGPSSPANATAARRRCPSTSRAGRCRPAGRRSGGPGGSPRDGRRRAAGRSRGRSGRRCRPPRTGRTTGRSSWRLAGPHDRGCGGRGRGRGERDRGGAEGGDRCGRMPLQRHAAAPGRVIWRTPPRATRG